MSRWELINDDKVNHILEFIATTMLMRYKDDVIIKITPEKTGSTIHMRSKSRVGKSDLGMNAQRIRDFSAKFREVEVR